MKDIQEIKDILLRLKQNGKIIPPMFIEKLDKIKEALLYFQKEGSIKKVYIGVTEDYKTLVPNFLIELGDIHTYNDFDRCDFDYKDAKDCFLSLLMKIVLIVLGPGVIYKVDSLNADTDINKTEELI